MFERPHHQRIARVLAALDAALLADLGCLFGGGTAIALRHGEFRESVDIDFLVSDLAGYRMLRQRVVGPGGISALCRPATPVQQLRELRADQYGIRTVIGVDGVAIKFEIVLEARIELQPPAAADAICGIATLTPLDMLASKLLANADRWADDGVFSRDLIDLAMMQPGVRLLRPAIAKAERAYGDSIGSALRSAVDHLLGRPGRLARCTQALGITLPQALLLQRVRTLAKRV